MLLLADKFAARHVQVFLITMCVTVGAALNLCSSVGVIVMSDPKNYNWGPREISLILSSFNWGVTLLLIPCGYVVNLWSSRILLSVSTLSSGVANLFIPWLAELADWQGVCAGRVAVGLGQACLNVCSSSLLSEWAPPAERARMSSIVSSGKFLGAIIAMPFSGMIAASDFGWPGIYYVFGALGIISSIVFFVYGSDSPKVHPTISLKERAFIMDSLQCVENHCDLERKRPPWGKILTSMSVWSLIIATSGLYWGLTIVNFEMPIYMNTILKYDIQKNGFISTLPFIANWLLSFPFGWLSDRALEKGVSVSVIRRVSSTAGTWLPALAFLDLCFVPAEDKTWTILLFTLAVGLKAAAFSGLFANQIDLSPNFAGTIQSVTTLVSMIVLVLAPIICGEIITDLTNINQWRVVFAITALVYFLTNLVFMIFGRGKIQSWNNPQSENTTVVNSEKDEKPKENA